VIGCKNATNQIQGSLLNENFFGGDENDYIEGMGGNDMLDGGSQPLGGGDTLDYSNLQSNFNITAKLKDNMVYLIREDGTHISNYVLNFEVLIGTRNNDLIYGSDTNSNSSIFTISDNQWRGWQ
jgi:hypothetical protein